MLGSASHVGPRGGFVLDQEFCGAFFFLEEVITYELLPEVAMHLARILLTLGFIFATVRSRSINISWVTSN